VIFRALIGFAQIMRQQAVTNLDLPHDSQPIGFLVGKVLYNTQQGPNPSNKMKGFVLLSNKRHWIKTLCFL